MISKAQYQQWLALDETRAFIDALYKDLQEIKEAMAAGEFNVETIEGTAMLYSSAVAQAKAVQAVIDHLGFGDFLDIEEEKE